MRTDDIVIELDQSLLTRWRIWYFLALALLAISLIGQQPIAFLAAFFVSLIAFVPDYWYRQALRHLVFTQGVSQHNVFFGEEVQAVDESTRRVAQQDDDFAGVHRELRSAARSRQSYRRTFIISDHGGVEVCETIDLRGARSSSGKRLCDSARSQTPSIAHPMRRHAEPYAHAARPPPRMARLRFIAAENSVIAS